MTTAFIILAAIVILFFALDSIAHGAITHALSGGASQFAAAILSGPFTWALVLVFILVVLGAFGILFGYR